MPYTSAEPVWGIAYSKWHAFDVRRTDRLCLNRLPVYARGNERETRRFVSFCGNICDNTQNMTGINTAALRFSPPFDSRDRVNTH